MQRSPGAGQRKATHPEQVVQEFLQRWRPFTELPKHGRLRHAVWAFLQTEDTEERRRIVAQHSELAKLHALYAEAGVLREERTERDAVQERLLALSVPDFARAIAAGDAGEYTTLLQEGFEFGRKETPMRQQLLRGFLTELFSQPLRGAPMKYSMYPNGVFYSGGGKTHEEMVREFSAQGYGGGLPAAGGQITRTEPLVFVYDLSSTAYRRTGHPKDVADNLKRAVRQTGGREDKVRFELDDVRG